MATYVIGDLQGCHATLQSLLTRLPFDRRTDRLIFVGDIVNRGTGSLACLRFVRDLGVRGKMVLGNHDLHLLAVAEGVVQPGRLDTLQELLAAPDAGELLAWLRQQPLLLAEETFAVVHAGLLPAWDWPQAQSLAGEVSAALRGQHFRELLVHMYGDEPHAWRDELDGYDRLRVVVNAMTRMRVIGRDGAMQLRYKGGLDELPKGALPWFRAKSARAGRKVLAGHWSALGLHVAPDFVGLDSGCVWGRELSALRVEDGKIFQAPCVASDRPPARMD